MVAKNYLSDYQIFTSGMHGIASKHPRMSEVGLSEHLLPHNMLFQCSAAFWFSTSTGAADGASQSLWNGTDTPDHAVAGESKFLFNPGFAEPTSVLLRGVIPLITLLGADLHVNSMTFTQVANFSTQAIINVVNGAGAAQGGIEGWVVFLGKRAFWKHGIAAPLAGKVFDGNGPNGENFMTSPLVGGVQVD